jgi:hypothetical protein
MVRPIEKSYSAVTRLLNMDALGLMLLMISCNYDVGLLQSALVAFIREARTDG